MGLIPYKIKGTLNNLKPSNVLITVVYRLRNHNNTFFLNIFTHLILLYEIYSYRKRIILIVNWLNIIVDKFKYVCLILYKKVRELMII